MTTKAVGLTQDCIFEQPVFTIYENPIIPLCRSCIAS